MANKKLPYFCRKVLQNFPFIEQDFDALTEYGLISKVVEYLNNVIKSQNIVIDTVNDLSNYFDNLDVQEEINNKLDKMAESGELQEIISAYLQANVTWTFDSVANMKTATNLIKGSFAQTVGYYTPNDGGKALYYIRPVTTDDVLDNMFVIPLSDNTLVAEYVKSSEIVPESVGVYGDGDNDCTDTMQDLIDYTCTNGLNISGAGTYKITDTLTIPNVEHVNIKLKNIDATELENKPAFILDHTRYANVTVDTIEFTKSSVSDVHNSYNYLCGFLLKGTSYANINVNYIVNALSAFVLHSTGKSATEGSYYNNLHCGKSDTFNLIHMYTNDGAINGNTLTDSLHVISTWPNNSNVRSYSIINDAHGTAPIYQNNHNILHGLMIEKYNDDGTNYSLADLRDANNTDVEVERLEITPSVDINNIVTTNTNSSYNLVKIDSGWVDIPRALTRSGNNNYITSFNNYKNSLNNTLYINDGGATLTNNFSAVTNGICDGTITFNPATGNVRINGIFTNKVDLSANTNYQFANIGLPGRTYTHGFVYLAGGGNPTTMTQIGTIRRVKNQYYCYLRVSQNVVSGNYLFVDFTCEE